MRERIRDLDRLQHIIECINNIETYLQGKTFDDMKTDGMCFHAVVYNTMIIGEAANMLTHEFRSEHADVPWRDIVDMRNHLVHGYVTTNAAYIWDTYKEDLPFLKERIGAYIKELTTGL